MVGVDGFELAYDRFGAGPAVVLLRGWPGDRTDYRDLVPLLAGCEAVLPDLRGFGESDKHEAEPARLRPVAGAGHFAPLEFPGLIAEEILAFLT